MGKSNHSSARNNFIHLAVNSTRELVTNQRNPKLVDDWSRVRSRPPTVEREKTVGAHDFIDRAAGSDITRRKSEDTRGLLQRGVIKPPEHRRGRDQLSRQFSRELSVDQRNSTRICISA